MKEILIKSYNKDALKYEDKFKDLQYKKYELFLSSLLPTSSFKLADFGCGTAMLKSYLDKRYSNIEYFGVDLSEEMVKIAKVRSNNITCCDIGNTPYSNEYFDVVTSFTVLRIILDDELKIFREMHRVLKPNGTLFLSILSNRVDMSLYKNLEFTGFKLIKKLDCGQDTGFILKRVGENTYGNSII